MHWTIFTEYQLVAAFWGFIGGIVTGVVVHSIASPRRSARPLRRDLRNCALLLGFLEKSFHGGVMGDLKMDELTQSFKNVLESVWKDGL